MNIKKIKEFLEDKEHIDKIIEDLHTIYNERILFFDITHRKVSKYLDTKTFQNFIEKNSINDDILQYTIGLFRKLFEMELENQKLEEIFDTDFIKENEYLLKKLKKEIKNNNLISDENLFHYYCLNDKLNYLRTQLITKEINGNKLQSGLIKINKSSSDEDKREEITFEVSKNAIKYMKEEFEKLYEKMEE